MFGSPDPRDYKKRKEITPLQPGDRVRVKDISTSQMAHDLDVATFGTGVVGWLPGMRSMIGEECTIQDVRTSTHKERTTAWYRISGCRGALWYSHAWLEPLTTQREKVETLPSSSQRCLLCGSDGYAGFTGFECSNQHCDNFNAGVAMELDDIPF